MCRVLTLSFVSFKFVSFFFHFLSFVLSLKVYVNIKAWVEVVSPSCTLYFITIVQRLELNLINSKPILYTQIVGLSRGCREPIIHAPTFDLSQVHRELILLTAKVFFNPYKLVFYSPHPHTSWCLHPPPHSISPSSTLGPNYSPFSTPLFIGFHTPFSSKIKGEGILCIPIHAFPFSYALFTCACSLYSHPSISFGSYSIDLPL